MYDLAFAIRTDGIALNRVAISNQILGARYDYARDNPIVVVSRGSRRVVYVCGNEIAKWSVNDLHSVEVAYQRLDAVADVLWYLRRAGYLSCGDFIRSTK